MEVRDACIYECFRSGDFFFFVMTSISGASV